MRPMADKVEVALLHSIEAVCTLGTSMPLIYKRLEVALGKADVGIRVHDGQLLCDVKLMINAYVPNLGGIVVVSSG